MHISSERIAELIIGNLVTVGIVMFVATWTTVKVEKQLHFNGTTTKYSLLL